ncbi:class II aaRS and biotin synthetase [Jaminaea rosea]|uniref:threonine--tRNA ligase n=1 Tax=Jaminaea rosea TaxID=1569628 RepID=A0A316URB2_9BASI|nr:class II aaRS and biotin synthetase [Jaminaea rosea]PWN27817.1 class II aaRS and biotin synthetase [Jaminaea rosea]
MPAPRPWMSSPPPNGSATSADEERLGSQIRTRSDMKQQGREGGHLAIGKSQSLFMTHAHSAGSPFLLPHGTRLARRVERVIRDLYDVHDYDEVITPQIYRKKLWEQSGHWDNYREDMFGVEGFKEQQRKEMKRAAKVAKVIEERRGCCAAHDAEGSGQSDASTSASASTSTTPLPDMDFGLKPMNCPGHCLIYSSQPRSLSDLPLRFSEWSPLHRNEPSGSLSGLTRVRRFVQDDAHVFCAPEQIKAEIATMLTMLSDAYSVFGFPNFEVVLSTRPSKSLGRQEDWDRAEQALQEALDEAGVRWTCNHGDGAFYGPKIDIRLVDSLQRKHQTATIQLDFQLPERFGLTYEPGAAASAETTSVHRPVMIHRAILGSVERFLAILMESREGAWPFWLSPRQACIIPVTTSPEVLAYCEKVRKQLSLGLDYEAEDGGVAPRSLQRFFIEMSPPSSLDMRLSKRIKRAQLAGYNFLIIVGEGEMKASTVKAVVEGNGSWWKRLRSSAADGVEAQLFGESGELSSSGEREAGQMEMGSYEVGKLRALWEKMDRCHL